jgi:hypothetical protein
MSREPLDDLVHAARRDLPDAERLRGIGRSLGFAAPPLVGASAAASAAKGATAAKGALAGLGLGTTGAKVGLAVVLVLGATGGVVALRGGESTPAPHAPSAVPAVVVATSSPVTLDLPVPVNARPPAPVDTAPPALVVAPPPPPAPIEARRTEPSVAGSVTSPPSMPSQPAPAQATELELLDQAERALHAQPAVALELADRHARRFPAGGYAQEREMIAIQALVRLGRSSDASARAERFRRSFPGSAYERRLDALTK